MPLIYSAVARGSAVLAEYSVFAGNFNPVAKDYLSKTAANAGRFTHTVDNHVFSFLSEDGYNFVVVTDEAAGRTIPGAFLDRLKADFVARYGEKGLSVKEGGLGNYGKKLKDMMEHATQFPEEYSKVTSVQKKVDEVKNIMSDNIDKVLSRGEKLDLLVDKTDNLMFEADRFVKSGRALRRKMWWNSCKMKAVMAGVVVTILCVIVLLACFSAGGAHCIKKKAPGASPSPSPYVTPTPSDMPINRPLAEPTPAKTADPATAAPAAPAPATQVPVLDGATIGGGTGSLPRRILLQVVQAAIGHAY